MLGKTEHKRFLELVCAVALTALIGCGSEKAPLASADENATLEQSAAPAYISFGAPGSAKIAVVKRTEKVSGWFFQDQWGSIEYSDWSWGDDDTNGSIILKRAWFAVEWGGIHEATEISMTASWGKRVKDVSIAFTPSGLDFSPPSTLEITLHGPLQDSMFNQQVYHTDSNGHTSQLAIAEIRKERNDGNNSQWVIVIKIPGFSRYSLGGGS